MCDKHLLEKWNIDRCALRLIEQKTLKSSVVGIMGQDSWKNEKSTQMFCVQNALHSLNTKGPYDVNVKIVSDKLRKGPRTMQKKKKKPKRLWTFSKWAETVISVLKCCSLLRILGQCIVMRMASGELLFYRLASPPFIFVPSLPIHIATLSVKNAHYS